MRLILNNTPMSQLFYSPNDDEYHYVNPGSSYDTLPDDAQFVQDLYHENLLQYAVVAYNMDITGIYLEPVMICQ